MEDTEIRFESMPDFSYNSPTEEKEYNSLFDELEDKCNPDRFMNPFIQERFDLANELYAELLKRVQRDDNSLKEIRDKAINGLGIHISTDRLYKYLLEYCDPKIYTAMKPYNKERVQEAGRLYAMIQDAKDDIYRLEAIEEKATSFIKKRKEELVQINEAELRMLFESQQRQKEEDKRADKRLGLTILIFVVIVIIGLAIKPLIN